MTPPPRWAGRRMGALRRVLLTATVAASLTVPAVPAMAGDGHGHGDAETPPPVGSTDYQQVIDITFPFEPSVAVRYRDDYDASRGGGRYHQSTDLMVAGGTPVHAAMGGTVVWISGSRDGGPPSYGWMLRIAGDDGRSYAYVHLGWQDRPWEDAYAPGVDRGARVERGDLIGWAGCSGSASCGGGEHLHFEIHDGNVEDPYDYHDHERINPYWSLVAAEERGDYPMSGSFLDVGSDNIHADDIEALAAAEITKGCGDRRFCPTGAVTRQQMASFLVRALDLPPAEAAAFTDVSGENLHAADIAAMAAAGITRGCGGQGFCPSDPVTRQQMASFLVRALDLPPADDAAFDDVAPDNVHGADIAALAAAGITKGCGNGGFCPEDVVTRQQMASFLVRALGLRG